MAEGRARSLRVKEHRLLLLYKETFRPERFHLVSRARVPAEIRAELESNGIVVHDGVEIGDPRAREPLAEEIAALAEPAGPPTDPARILDEALAEALEAAESGAGDPVRVLGEAVLRRLAAAGDPRASRIAGAGGALKTRRGEPATG